MKALSLKLREDIFREVESVVRKIHVPRNAYINEALLFYNKLNKRRFLRKQFEKESRLVRSASLEILHEFENLEGDPD